MRNEHGITEKWLTGILFILMGLLAGFSALVATGVLLVKYGLQTPLISLVSGSLYMLLLVSAAVWAGRVRPAGSDRLWTGVLVLGPAVFKVLLVMLCRDYLQLGDRATFIRFMEALAAGGLGTENLASLTGIFDYRAWLSRAFPFALPVRWLFGSRHIFFYQLLNVALSSLSVYLFCKLAFRVLSRPAARAAGILYALFPLRLFYVIEYTHQLQVEFFVLASTLILVQLMSAGRQGGGQWFRAILLGVLLFLLRLQLGWDVLMLVAVLGAFVFMLSDPAGRGKRGKLVAWLCMACAVYWLASIPFDRWAGQHEIPTSGVPGFMARGWGLETLGEYHSLPEHLEMSAPSEDRAQTMYAYILSQIYYHPRAVVLKLLPAKMAKYFLVGYATDMDWTFEQSGMPVLGRVFTGMRIFSAPVFLVCVVIGCIGLLRRRDRGAEWFPVVLLPVIACGVFVLFGETSPRYSFYVHAHMALIAASVFEFRNPSEGFLHRAKRALALFAGGAAALICVYFLIMLAVVSVVRAKASPRVFADMQGSAAGRPALARFERTLMTGGEADDGAASVSDSITVPPSAPELPKTVLYFWPAGDGVETRGLDCAITVNGSTRYSEPLKMTKTPVRVEWMSDGAGDQLVTVTLSGRPVEEGISEGPSAGVRWGYVHSLPAAKRK